jgi:hypothetical protein
MSSHTSDFGISPHNPIRVGGGGLFGPFNERQYLARLRCRNGEPPKFMRVGSVEGEHATTPLDLYELSGAGLTEPVRLYLDIYRSAPSFEAPSGFVLARPDEPLNLPRSLVISNSFLRASQRMADAPPQQQPPQRWRILDSAGRTLGLAAWDGLTHVALTLPQHLEPFIRKIVDHFLSSAPPDQFKVVLEDIFERYLVLQSNGALHGIPDNTQEELGKQTARHLPAPEETLMSNLEPPLAWELHSTDGPRGDVTWLGGAQLDLNTGPALKGLLESDVAPLLAAPGAGTALAAYFERLRVTSGGAVWAKPVPRELVLETLYADYKRNELPDDLSPAALLAATLAGKLLWTTTRNSVPGAEAYKAGGQRGGKEHWLIIGTKAGEAGHHVLTITTGPADPPRLVEQRDGFFRKSALGKLLAHLRNGGGRSSKREPRLPTRASGGG